MSRDAVHARLEVGVIARKTPAGHRLSDAPAKSPGGQPVPEGEALAELLAELVMLAGQRAMFPGRLEEIAERAQEHESVRRALRASGERRYRTTTANWAARVTRAA